LATVGQYLGESVPPAGDQADDSSVLGECQGQRGAHTR